MATRRPIKERYAGMEGPAILKGWMRTHQVNIKSLAKKMGIGEHGIVAWLSSRSRPSLIGTYIVEDVTGIPASSWLSKEERTMRAPARR